MALLARFEAGVGEHPAQVDDQLSVDVLAVWRLEDLGLAAELDLDLAVGLLGCRSDGLQQRQHLAPLEVAAQGVAEELLERVAMVVVEVRCHEVSSSGLRRHRLPECARPNNLFRERHCLGGVSPYRTFSMCRNTGRPPPAPKDHPSETMLIGVRPTEASPVDGPPSSARSERNH